MLLYIKTMDSLNRLLLFRFFESICCILLGLTTNFSIVLVIIGLSSCAKVIANISLGTSIEVITDKDILGRVMGFQSAVGSLLTLVTLIIVSQVSIYMPISTIYLLSGCLGIGLLLLHLIQSVWLTKSKAAKTL